TSFVVPADLAGKTADAAHNMVDACNLVGRANVNALSALIAGLPAGSCTPLPATSTFENLFPYDPFTSDQITPHALTTVPSNNGLAKVDYSPNVRHHFDGFFYISRESTSSGSPYQPYWSTLG